MIALDAHRLELTTAQGELVPCTRPGCTGMARRSRIGASQVIVCSECIAQMQSLMPARGQARITHSWERAQVPPRWRGLTLASHKQRVGKRLPPRAEREPGCFYAATTDQSAALLHLHLWRPRGLVVLAGPEGVGKTHLAAGWLGGRILETPSLWINEEALLELEKSVATRPQVGEQMRLARAVPILVWDRWGACDVAVSAAVLAARFEACLPTLLTTRLTREQARKGFPEWGMFLEYLREGATRREAELREGVAPLPIRDGWLAVNGPDARAED